MNYINVNSNRGIVNLFADYVVKKINEVGEFDSIIEVTDCGKFFILNGFTSKKEILDLTDVKVKFSTEYQELLNTFGYDNINIIDLLTYDVGLEKKDEMWFKFYPSTRALYPQELINNVNSRFKDVLYHSITPDMVVELDFSQKGLNEEIFKYVPLNITSEFPHGYSLSMGRDMLYYSEYICTHYEHNLRTGEVNFKFSLSKDDNDDYNIEVITESVYTNGDIKSLTLDVFDFNLERFRNKLKKYDIIEDLTKPFDNKPWVTKDKLSDMYIF